MSKKDHPLYFTWMGMHNRCRYPSQIGWKHYGGRGIVVDPVWHGDTGFWQFVEDMGPKPGTNYSLNRVDNDGPYAPWNCEWATHEEQANNKSVNRVLSINGEEATMAQWAKRLGISLQTLAARLNKLGWPPELALSTEAGTIHAGYLKPGQWSRNYTECQKCGGTSKPHTGQGLCRPCYRRERYLAKGA